MKKKIILVLIAAIAMISAGAQTCVPQFKCGPYGVVVILTPVEGQAPFTYVANNQQLSSNVLFLPYDQQTDVQVTDANEQIAITRLCVPSSMKNFFDPADIEVGEREISIDGCEMIVVNGELVMCGDTTISRPSSGWVKVVSQSIPWIDTTINFDTVTIFDTITVVEIDPASTNANVSLYPNPTVGQLNIECPSVIREVAIFNTLGQQVVTSYNLGNKGSMDLATLPKGTYTMRITLNDGRESVYKLVRN